MTTGTVKWFNEVKGWGFIQPDGGGPDVFAHYSEIQLKGFRVLKPGARVEFDPVAGEKGALAHNIRVLDPEHTATT